VSRLERLRERGRSDAPWTPGNRLRTLYNDMSYSVSMPSLRSAFEILPVLTEEQRARGCVSIDTGAARGAAPRPYRFTATVTRAFTRNTRICAAMARSGPEGR